MRLDLTVTSNRYYLASKPMGDTTISVTRADDDYFEEHDIERVYQAVVDHRKDNPSMNHTIEFVYNPVKWNEVLITRLLQDSEDVIEVANKLFVRQMNIHVDAYAVELGL